MQETRWLIVLRTQTRQRKKGNFKLPNSSEISLLFLPAHSISNLTNRSNHTECNTKHRHFFTCMDVYWLVFAFCCGLILNLCRYGFAWDLDILFKEPTHLSKRVGDVVTGVVVYLFLWFDLTFYAWLSRWVRSIMEW